METNILSALSRLSNDDLLARVKQLAERERQATAILVAHIAELDARRLYLEQGCASLFTYCTELLHMSESAAYSRIEAARALRRFPVILEMLTHGSLTLTAVKLLARHLTPDNHGELLAAACHKSTRQVEELVAGVRPQPPVPASVRKLPTPRPPQPSPQLPPATTPPPPAHRPVVAPLAPDLYKLQFSVRRETLEKLRLAEDLLLAVIPRGDTAAIVDRALTVLLDDLLKKKFGCGGAVKGDDIEIQGDKAVQVKKSLLEMGIKSA